MTRGASSTTKAPSPPSTTTTGPASEPGEGIRSLKTSGVFRAVNFELYAKPVSSYSTLGFIHRFLLGPITGIGNYLWPRGILPLYLCLADWIAVTKANFKLRNCLSGRMWPTGFPCLLWGSKLPDNENILMTLSTRKCNLKFLKYFKLTKVWLSICNIVVFWVVGQLSLKYHLEEGMCVNIKSVAYHLTYLLDTYILFFRYWPRLCQNYDREHYVKSIVLNLENLMKMFS